MNWAAGIVAFGAVIATTAVLLVFQYGQARIFFSMARDGLLSPSFAKIHPRSRRRTSRPSGSASSVGRPGRVREPRRLRRADEHRDALRLRPRVRRHHGPAPQRSRPPARVPHAVRADADLGSHRLTGIGVPCIYARCAALPTATWIRFVVWLVLGLVIYFLVRVPQEPSWLRRVGSRTRRRLLHSERLRAGASGAGSRAVLFFESGGGHESGSGSFAAACRRRRSPCRHRLRSRPRNSPGAPSTGCRTIDVADGTSSSTRSSWTRGAR